MDVRKTPTEDVKVPTSVKLSKSACQRLLRKYFNQAQIKNRTTVEDTAAGNQRWQVWCAGAFGKAIAVVEVSGKPELLPKAAVIASLRRINLVAEFINKDGLSVVRVAPVKKESALDPKAEGAPEVDTAPSTPAPAQTP